MANFLSGNNIVLINADKINSGNLINEYIQTDCKIHHASTSSIGYQNKNYTNYYYEDFISLSNNFINDLNIKNIDAVIFFIKDNKFFKQTKKNNLSYFDYQKLIINLSNKLIQKLKKNSYSKFFFILLPLAFYKEKNSYIYETLNSSFIGYTLNIAKNYGKYKILSNSIFPGYFLNDLKKIISLKKIDNLKEKIPLKRYANLNDLSSAILFFSSEYNTYVTGQVINIDGGFNSIW